MKKLVALTGILAALCTANAQNFQASMDGLQDGGGLRTGTGTASLTLSGTSLSYTVSFSGLSAPSSAGHIHGPAIPGVSAGILHPFTFTTGATSGSFSGTWTGMSAQNISDLNAGLLYVNIHSVGQFSGGEIRGQITAVPEPSTYALIGSTALLGLAFRRKK